MRRRAGQAVPARRDQRRQLAPLVVHARPIGAANGVERGDSAARAHKTRTRGRTEADESRSRNWGEHQESQANRGVLPLEHERDDCRSGSSR